MAIPITPVGVSGSGTTGILPIWLTSTSIADSKIQDGIAAGILTVAKAGATARTATFPDAAVLVTGSAAALTTNRLPKGTATSGVAQDSQIADAVTGGVLTIAGTLTAVRTVTFPDASVTIPSGTLLTGTLANANRLDSTSGAGVVKESLIADGIVTSVLTLAGTLTVPRTKTLQNTTATLAELETAQTFTLAQTFSTTATFNANLIIGTGGTYVAGSIYSDASWGMLFRAKQAAPAGAEFRWSKSDDTELMRLDSNANLGVGVTPVAGNGQVQLAPGTTKATGVAHGDTFQFRYTSGGIDTTGPAATDIVNRVTRSTGEACVFAAIASTALLGAQSNHPLTFVTNNSGRLTLSANGLTATWFDGMSFSFGATTGTQLGSATTQKLGFWGATPVVQQAGYGTPTGAALLTNFPGATATLAQTSGALADLLTKLKSMGLIGA